MVHSCGGPRTKDACGGDINNRSSSFLRRHQKPNLATRARAHRHPRPAPCARCSNFEFVCLFAWKWKLENGNDSAFAREPSGTSKQKHEENGTLVRWYGWAMVAGVCRQSRVATAVLAVLIVFVVVPLLGHLGIFRLIYSSLLLLLPRLAVLPCCCAIILFVLASAKVFRHISWRHIKLYFCSSLALNYFF